MPSLHPPRAAALLTLPLLLAGCARPGPPRAPSLRIPAVVTDLTAARTGNLVDLHFTAPTRASDNVPLPAGPLRGVLCRQLGPATTAPAACTAVTGINLTIAPHAAGEKSAPQAVSLQDTLPAELTTGAPRLLNYRVQFFGPTGGSVGESEPAYSVAGAAPPPVSGLTATGARNGIILTWKPEDGSEGEVLLERTDLAPSATPAPKPQAVTVPHRARHATATPERTAANVTWLDANAGTGRTSDTTLDATVDPDTPYRYRALRRTMVRLGGRTLELRSELSSSQTITLTQTYAPATPTGLAVAAYFERFGAAQTNELAPTFAVDLVWQPVDDDTRTAPLAGYNVTRETLGAASSPATRLNSTPVLLPAFHDATAQPTQRYRYRVTAIDTRGNESSPATTTLEAQSNNE